MTLSKDTSCQLFQINQPRWHDKTVLLAKYRVGQHNEVIFRYARNYPDSYYLSGEEIKQHPIETNGTIECYAIPLNKLELLERI